MLESVFLSHDRRDVVGGQPPAVDHFKNDFRLLARLNNVVAVAVYETDVAYFQVRRTFSVAVTPIGRHAPGRTRPIIAVIITALPVRAGLDDVDIFSRLLRCRGRTGDGRPGNRPHQ